MIYDTKPGCIDVDLAAEAGGNIKSKITVELSIENMQIGAIKPVDEERLRRLDLPTLTYRRETGDRIEIYKQIHNYDE